MTRRLLWTILLCGACAVNAQVLRLGDVITMPDGSKGVVYYLHPDGSGGWAVALNDVAANVPWGSAIDVEGLPHYNRDFKQESLGDTAGYGNTLKIRSAQGNDPNCAAWVVDLENGWVLPSPQQMYMLYVQSPVVVPALEAAGGTDLQGYNYYWVSAQVDDDEALAMYFSSYEDGYSGFFSTMYKSSSRRVRAVRNFTYPLYSWSTGAGTPAIELVPDQTSNYSVTVRPGYRSQGTADTTIVVLPKSSSLTEEAVCGSYEWSGNTYTESGVYTIHFTAANGCDSAATLKLAVSNMPEVSIETSNSSICLGDSATLQIASEPFLLPPPVAEGDILCTDGSIVKPGVFGASGKTAKGVVFYVDSTGLHGWAVHLHDQATGVNWCGSSSYSVYGANIPGVSDFDPFRSEGVYPDLKGYANTQALWAAGDSTTYPAAHCVDFPNGWYLPDIGQLEKLFAAMPFIASSLTLAGGEPFSTDSPWFYWSSSEVTSYSHGAWCLDSAGRASYTNKTDYELYQFDGVPKVRGIRDF